MPTRGRRSRLRTDDRHDWTALRRRTHRVVARGGVCWLPARPCTRCDLRPDAWCEPTRTVRLEAPSHDSLHPCPDRGRRRRGHRPRRGRASEAGAARERRFLADHGGAVYVTAIRIHGRHPGGLGGRPASKPWPAGQRIETDPASVDTFRIPGSPINASMAVAAQHAPQGTTSTTWLTKWEAIREDIGGHCFGSSVGWMTATVVGLPGWHVKWRCDSPTDERSNWDEYTFLAGGMGYVIERQPDDDRSSTRVVPRAVRHPIRNADPDRDVDVEGLHLPPVRVHHRSPARMGGATGVACVDLRRRRRGVRSGVTRQGLVLRPTGTGLGGPGRAVVDRRSNPVPVRRRRSTSNRGSSSIVSRPTTSRARASVIERSRCVWNAAIATLVCSFPSRTMYWPSGRPSVTTRVSWQSPSGDPTPTRASSHMGAP